KLTYNTDTGQIVGEGGSGGQVHMILQPQKKAAPAKKPAAASSAATVPAQPATSAPAKPSSAAPALDLHPASASSD
ncbi:MAG TPA: lipopolysaccharide transport periplasmic protein LptA, partial [Rhodanobacteraceae bacterium]|nr:lipopolysaccharide transport periplasmic protein LptA [Rhodanobacteraceae bacterium]